MVLATGGIGKACKITSNSWEYTGDGHALAYDAGAELIDMEFVQFHPTGMVWPPSVRGHPRHRGRARRGRHAAEQRGRAVHVPLHPGVLQERRRRTPRRRPTAGTRTRRTTGARPTCCRATSSRARSTPRSRRAAARRTAACSSTSPRAARRTTSSEAALDVPPVQGAGRRRHHEGADGGRPDLPLHDGRRPRRRRHGGDRPCPACSPRARSPAGMHGANRLGGNSLSDLLVFGRRAGLYAAEHATALQGTLDGRRAADRGGGRARCSRPSSARRARTRTRSTRTSRRSMQSLVGHHPHARRS